MSVALEPVWPRSALAVALAAVWGCGSPDPLPEAGPDTRGSFAVLQVERVRFDGALPGQRFEHFEIGGRVARFAGLEREEAAALIGLGTLGEPDDIDACGPPTPVLPSEDLVEGAIEGSEIELVDVGTIEVRAGDRSLSLEPQSFPGLMNLMQGAIYGSSEGEGVAWESGADWSFVARGAPGIGPFDAETEAPDELVVTRIGSDDPTVSPPLVERGSELPVRWEAGARDDFVRIELTWIQLGTEMRLSCAAADDGSFVVPASALRTLPDPGLVASPRLIVRRERRRNFTAGGIDEGVLVVALTEWFDARVR